MASDCRCCPPDTEQSHEATDWPQPKVRESPRWLFLRGSYSLSAAMIVASTDPCSAIYAEISCATVARSAPASQYREAICAFRLVLKILTSALRLEHCSSRRNFRIREACRKRDAGTAHTVDILSPFSTAQNAQALLLGSRRVTRRASGHGRRQTNAIALSRSPQPFSIAWRSRLNFPDSACIRPISPFFW